MLDWATYILLTIAVGVVTFGLIYLLFAEVFRGARLPEDRPSGAPDSSLDAVTEEERSGLTNARYWRNRFSKTSPRSEPIERRGAPAEEDDRLPGHGDER